MLSTASISQNHYLDAYDRFYSFRDIEFDQKHVEHVLTNFLHLQDLINKNVQDLAYLMGCMLQGNGQSPNPTPRNLPESDKLTFQLKNTSNISHLVRKEKSNAEKFIRGNRYKVMKAESDSKPKAFRLNSQDSRKSGDSKMRIESQENAQLNSQSRTPNIRVGTLETDIGYSKPDDSERFVEKEPKESVEPEYKPIAEDRITSFSTFLRSSDKLIIQKLESASFNAECFKETKRAVYSREPVRIIERKKDERQKLNGYECFECKKVG